MKTTLTPELMRQYTIHLWEAHKDLIQKRTGREYLLCDDNGYDEISMICLKPFEEVEGERAIQRRIQELAGLDERAVLIK